MSYRLCLAIIFTLACFLSGLAASQTKPPERTTVAQAPTAPTSPRREARTVDWEELLPPGERNLAFVQPSGDYLDEDGPSMKQVGSSRTNTALNGKFVKIPGFVVPLSMTQQGVVTEFLLVPYFGACIHIPPPPPNQIVYVKMQKGIRLRSIYDPQWITGMLSTATTDTRMASAAYLLAGEKIEPYEY